MIRKLNVSSITIQRSGKFLHPLYAHLKKPLAAAQQSFPELCLLALDTIWDLQDETLITLWMGATRKVSPLIGIVLNCWDLTLRIMDKRRGPHTNPVDEGNSWFLLRELV